MTIWSFDGRQDLSMPHTCSYNVGVQKSRTVAEAKPMGLKLYTIPHRDDFFPLQACSFGGRFSDGDTSVGNNRSPVLLGR